MAEQWAPFAVRRTPTGQAQAKHGYDGKPEPGRKEGIVMHSMEGPLSAALGELDKVARRASWTFSNPKAGPLLQHFPVGYHTWASGSLVANVRFTSCEHEGVAGEPLTQNQINNDVALLRWLRREHGWTGYVRLEELWEHNEAVTAFGGGATACPSNRIPWPRIIAALQEDTVTPEQMQKLLDAIKAQGDRAHDDMQALLNFLKLALTNLDQDHTRIEAKIK